jgi:2-dehydro-3-deoxygluconokinase
MKNKVVTFGEIMLRLATPGYLRFAQTTEFEATFGGGEANVAVSLASYGIPQAVSVSADIGDYAISTLRL